MNAALTHLRREYWEHRGRFLWVHVVIFALFMLASLILGIAVGGGFTDIHPVGLADSASVAILGYGIGFIFYIFLAFGAISYLVNCLSEDRVDKSVLFWRSLPVSDSATVLSKVGAFTLLGAAIVWIATILTHLLVLFAIACMASARGAEGFSVFTSLPALFGTWALFAWAMLLNALWWLPYIGWLLLISAIFRKRTFFWAIFPPIIVGFVEEFITGIFTAHTSSHFFHFITRNLVTAPVYPWMQWGISSGELTSESHYSFMASAGNISHFLAQPSMWIGFGIGVGLIAITIVVRRYTATA